MTERHHEGLIYTMVLASAADSDMSTTEVATISDMVKMMPVFHDLDETDISHVSEACADMLNSEDGLDDVLDFIADTVPKKLHETAYAIACDVVAADLAASQEELRLLEMLRHRLGLERLVAAAIERGSRARHVVV
jgi:tellurite resistance protein